MRGNGFQITLIIAAAACLGLLGVFFYREVAPEYKLYQNDYISLEEFRSTYTGLPPPLFKPGIKQIVLESDGKGNPTIDRCTSCHVALDIPYFSPTRLARDLHGQLRLNEQGWPIQEENPDYIWAKLDEKIADLPKREAERLEDLKVAQVGDYTYDVTKVLRAHPLIGRETRPFEFHPIAEYGCTSCHNGNGRALTTEKAHGPVLDEFYHHADTGPKKVFLETDDENDPQFARIFNHKPGHSLLFQTTPLYLGALIEAKCAQCHRLEGPSAVNASIEHLTKQQIREKTESIEQSLKQDRRALFALTQLAFSVEDEGKEATIAALKEKENDFSYPRSDREQFASQIAFLQQPDPPIYSNLQGLLGEAPVVQKWLNQAKESANLEATWKMFRVEHFSHPQANGLLFTKNRLLNEQRVVEQQFADPEPISRISRDVSLLTKNLQQGQELYFSQACYACHRITGLARGGIGPELTRAGDLYPWYLKESIVWPQADLETSTMPNMHLDHGEVEDLLAFLLAQKGPKPGASETAYKIGIQNWEAGEKLPWEKPVPPVKIRDVQYAMTVFATEGCAACHRLKGYDSNVGFANNNPSALSQERAWFQRLIPEEITGSELSQVLYQHAEEIDRRIVDGVHEDSLLEEIEKASPGTLMSYNSNFLFAKRKSENQEWTNRVDRVYQMYMQEYGVGRLIGPRPNWSGVYRTDQWLMEHFRNPTALIPRSIMPVFPFDDTKFYSLTYMLDVLGVRNRDAFRQRWKENGFDPAKTFDILCSQCHGDDRQGNGPVAEWIYPVPKNLRNADFLRNLTREKAKKSILEGVPGTPMPPWGTAAMDKPMADGVPVLTEPEIDALLDWIYSALPGGEVIRGKKDVRKWQYDPEDVLRDLEKEGVELPPSKQAMAYLASQTPMTQSTTVSDLFDQVQEKLPNGEIENKYYIKKEYYTPENLDEAQKFFNVHCAVCHGKEGDGAGERSGTMLDAKPRMLTNLDWIDERDDLRLLRSIKYGVTGTSMVAWGDQTTALKRLQLVMYVRQLSAQQLKHKQIYAAIYQNFDAPLSVIHSARAANDREQQGIQEEIRTAKRAQTTALREERPAEPLVQATQQLTDAQKQAQPYQQRQETLDALKESVMKERELFAQLAKSLLRPDVPLELSGSFLSFLQTHQRQWHWEDGKIAVTSPPQKETLEEQLLPPLQHIVEQAKQQQQALKGRLPSPQKREEEVELQQTVSSFTKLIEQVRDVGRDSRAIEKKQQTLIETLNQKEQP